MGFKLSYKSYGSKAILIEWIPKIDIDILNDIISFRERIQEKANDTILDVIIGYNSLTIVYKYDVLDFEKETNHLKKIYKEKFDSKSIERYLWEIPVCYDIQFGLDLSGISSKTNLSIQEIIQLHQQTIYTVYFIGFLPGFLYLGGLETQLFVDRKSNPRLHVEKGSVGIGGRQTGIYPSHSAGGWNIIGKTPVNFFNVDLENPCFANSGDQIKFISISLDEYQSIEESIKNNTYSLSKTLLYD